MSDDRRDDAEAESRRETGDAGEGVDDEPIDTGIEMKGVRVNGELVRPVKPPLAWGDATDVDITVHELGDHEPPNSVDVDHDHDDDEGHGHAHRSDEDEAGDTVVKAVMVAGMYFEMPSTEVVGVDIRNEAGGYFARAYREMDAVALKRLGMDPAIDPPGSVINPAVARARIAFAENNRGKHELGLRRGRIHAPSLGMKAPVGDDSFFRQKRLPGRQDYFVGIGIDVSGSTAGVKIHLAKQVAMAEAEMLDRLGIPFFVYGHSGDYNFDDGAYSMDLVMIEIKRADEVWNEKTRERLRRIGPVSANLDGHSIQFYRKMLEQQRATTKILHYYSDGAMPCENFEEELEILTSEIKRYKRDGIILAGVGIRTDAPKQHGLDTVIVNEQKDVMAVVNDLEKRLLRR